MDESDSTQRIAAIEAKGESATQEDIAELKHLREGLESYQIKTFEEYDAEKNAEVLKVVFKEKLQAIPENALSREIAFIAANFINSQFRFIAPEDTGEVLYYSREEGIFRPAEAFIDKLARGLLCEKATSSLVKEIIGHLRAKNYIERSELNKNQELICAKNGIINILTGEFKEHSPDYYFTQQLPIPFIATATCPRIAKFLSEVLSPEDVLNVIELFGYCLYKGYPIQKIFMLHGDGANGKSTFIELLKAFLGSQNCSNIPLQQLAISRFAKAELYGKLANLYADIPANALSDTGTLKMLRGGDTVSAERKFKDFFSFVNHAKLIFSCNRIPTTYDDTIAFWRSWIIVPFPNTFLGDKANKGLLKELTTEGELSGMLNLALKALKGLLERGDFSNTKGVEEVKADYIRRSDSVGAFVMDNLEADGSGAFIKQELYRWFCEYCREKKLISITQDSFFKNIHQHLKLTTPKITINEKREYCFAGLKPKMSEASNLSNVLAVLSIGEFTVYIHKIGKPLDTSDTPNSKDSQALLSRQNQKVS